MKGTIINIWYSPCTYKRASCKGCYNRLVEGCKILSISRAQGKFNSVSNYCSKCTETELPLVMEEITPLFKKIIEIQETLDNNKK